MAFDAASRVEGLSIQLGLLYTRPGSPFEHDEFGLHKAHFDLLLQLGQFVTVEHEQELVGFQGWYRCGDDALALLMADDTNGLFLRRPALRLNDGPHCYIAASLVAPHAPAGTALKLFRATQARNRDALQICAMREVRGGRRWFRHIRGKV